MSNISYISNSCMKYIIRYLRGNHWSDDLNYYFQNIEILKICIFANLLKITW